MLAEGRDGHELLFRFTHDEWKVAAKVAAARAGLNPLRRVLYQLRHTGPSNDAAEGRRSLGQIKARGRWASDSSVRRYEKHSQLARQWQKLSPAAQVFAQRCLSHVGAILGAASAPTLPCDAVGYDMMPSLTASRGLRRGRGPSSSKASQARGSAKRSPRWA